MFAKIHKRTRIIAFNQYINKTSDLRTNSHAFSSLGNDEAQVNVISGNTRSDTRESIFKWFEQNDYHNTKIIFNASCIKEGIDLPCCDLVVFCDDK
jgi:superfamily II DNA or RNA helicase